MNFKNTLKKAVVATLLLVPWQLSNAQTSIYTPNQNIGDNTVNNNVKIGAALGTPGFMLDVNGDINIDFDDDETYYAYNYHDEPILSMKGYIDDQATYDFHTSANLLIGHGAGAALPFEVQTGITQGDHDSYNTLIGYQAGNSLNGSQSNKATRNVFVGYQAGETTTTANSCNFFGYQAGEDVTADANNLFGTEAGEVLTGIHNSFFGHQTGREAGLAQFNVYMGGYVGYSNDGDSNVFIGYEAGENSDDANNSVFIGWHAGHNTDGDDNIFIGHEAASANVLGENNTIIGFEAGSVSTALSEVVILGYQAGSANTQDAVTLIGYESGENNTGQSVTALGYQAGQSNSGSEVTSIGYQAGQINSGGSNTFMGHLSGSANTSGHSGVFIGHQSGKGNTTGEFNTYIGHWSGRQASGSASRNSCLGKSAGLIVQGNDNTLLGFASGVSTRSSNNVMVGSGAGSSHFAAGIDGRNVFIGHDAGEWNNGSNNVFIGFEAGQIPTAAGPPDTVESDSNVHIGYQAGQDNRGNANTFLGYQSGLDHTTGRANTFIGQNTGATITTESGNTLLGAGADIAAGTEESTAVGFGADVDEDNCIVLGRTGSQDVVFINDNGIAHASLGTNTVLYVNGDVETSSSNFLVSDRRFKKDIQNMTGALDKINQLNAVSYLMRVDEFPERAFRDGRQLGFIAQELKEIIPEVVKQRGDYYYMVDYTMIIPVLAQAIKEQQQQIEELKAGTTSSFGTEEKKDNGSITAALAGIETIKDWQAEFDAKLAEKDKQIASLQDRVSALESNTSDEVESLRAENEAMKSQMDALMARFDQLEQSVSGCCNNSGSGATFDKARLEQNTPNPFGTNTVIKYYVPQSAGSAYITVATAEGAELMKVNITEKGSGSVIISASTLTSGTYFYSLTVDGELIGAKKMVVVK